MSVVLNQCLCVTKCGKVRLILYSADIRMYVHMYVHTYMHMYVHMYVHTYSMHEMRPLALVHCTYIRTFLWSNTFICNTPPITIHSAANHL